MPPTLQNPAGQLFFGFVIHLADLAGGWPISTGACTNP